MPDQAPQLYWEDFRASDVVEIGRHTFTEEEIIEFARQFDPQPFHTDPEAAKDTFFGGLIASGWHTCAIAMRLMVQHYIGRSASARKGAKSATSGARKVMSTTATSAPTNDEVNAAVSAVPGRPCCASG